MKHVLISACCCLLLLCRAQAQSQSQTDTIYTTKGAVTLITCGSAITTFQIGDGKNMDYDYRIVEGNLVFIRPIVANPRPTNLVVREGENVHYLILAFGEKIDLARLKYSLSGSGAAKKTDTPAATATADNSPQGAAPEPDAAEDTAALADIDTVTVGRIAVDFMRQKKVNHLYEIKADGVTLSFAQAMSLNNLAYFCFRIRNRSGKPYEIAKVSLMHKAHKDSAGLRAMPVLYKKEPAAINNREDQHVVYVTPARPFRKDDEVILVLYNNANQNQLVLYTPASALPKYMLSK